MCPLQDPFRIRARYVASTAAGVLIDDEGGLAADALRQLLDDLAASPHVLVFHDGDEMIYRHLLSALQQLKNNESLWRAIKKCTAPLCNKAAEEIVRETLWPEKPKTIQTAHVRRAALTAYLTLLRQGTGSCFATAPAMLIQQENPILMIQDIEAILSAGQLRRGPYSVPMSPSKGWGELVKAVMDWPILLSPGLQAAFHAAGLQSRDVLSTALPTDTPQTIISRGLLKHFDLTEVEVAKETAEERERARMWEKRGGPLISSPKAKQIREYGQAKARAERAFCALSDCALLRVWEYTIASFSNAKVEIGRWNLFVSLGLHPEMPDGVGSLLTQIIQGKLNILNQKIAQIHTEHQTAVGAIRATEGLLHQSGSEARHRQLQGEMTAAMHSERSLGEMLSETVAMAEWLSALLPQWINGAAERLPESFQEVFDPALAQSAEKMEDTTAGFRLLYKHGRTAAASWERIENGAEFVEAVCRFFEMLERELPVPPLYQPLWTEIATELMQTLRSDAFLAGAMRRAHMNEITKKGTPWAYESGGTMETLVQNYFEENPVEFSRKIHSCGELYEFLSAAQQKTQGCGSWLIHSPTHAFIFTPAALSPLESRDRFWQGISFSHEEAEFLAERFALFLPEAERPLFYFGYRQKGVSNTLSDVRQGLILGARAAGQTEASVDAFLYESLPLFSPAAQRKKPLRNWQSPSARRARWRRLPSPSSRR